jgi:hypothetical protein
MFGIWNWRGEPDQLYGVALLAFLVVIGYRWAYVAILVTNVMLFWRSEALFIEGEELIFLSNGYMSISLRRIDDISTRRIPNGKGKSDIYIHEIGGKEQRIWASVFDEPVDDVLFRMKPLLSPPAHLEEQRTGYAAPGG